LTAEEIAKVLSNNGQKKAVTTIRHHLEALKNAGLIEATKMVEIRGAVLKYYSPTVLAFDHEPLQGLDHHAKLVHEAEQKIVKILKAIYTDKKFISAFDKPSTPCPMCKVNHDREFAALEIINHSIANAMQSKEFVELVLENKELRSNSAKT
jgi:DNA-binding transcriptional ArsR family regulator